MSLPFSPNNPPRKVLFVSGIGGDTRRYRCLHAQEQLALHGISSQLCLHTDHAILTNALKYDLCILHRVPYSELVGDLLALLRRQGKPAIYDTDDLVFAPDIVNQIRLLDKLSPKEARRYRRDVSKNQKTMLACDHVLVPTDYLAQKVKALGRQTTTHRNALSAEYLRLAEDIYTGNLNRRQETKERVVIGYASGTPSHDRDFLEAADALLHLMGKYQNVDLHIIGYLTLDDRFAAWAKRIRQTPHLPWQQVPAVAGGFDINLAPLERLNPFCQGKSELKYFAAGALGVPTVASRSGAFEYAIRHGENGFLAGNTQEWLAALELLITDAETRHSVGTRARKDVLQNYTPTVRAKSLVGLLSKIWQQVPATLTGSQVGETELAQDLIERQQKHLSRQQETITKMKEQIEEQDKKLIDYETQIADLEYQIADLRQIWASQLEGPVAARRRTIFARAMARGKTLVKKWFRQRSQIEIKGRIASPGPELIKGQSQGQTFIAAQDGLHRLEILFATFGRVNTGQIIFKLRSWPDSLPEIATITIKAAELKDNRYHHFDFEPLARSAGRAYHFCLEAPNSVPGDAVGIWAFENAKAEGWTRYIGRKPIGGQIVFLARYLKYDKEKIT